MSKKGISPYILSVIDNKYMILEYAEGRLLDHNEIVEWFAGQQTSENELNSQLLLSTISQIHHTKSGDLNSKPTI